MALFLATIINGSMDESMMLMCLKWAIITPLLKRSQLDKEDLKNYHPISNLPFIFKLIEKVVARHTGRHNYLNDIYQSLYHRGHSTETVLLKVHTDITEALDEGSRTALIVWFIFWCNQSSDTTEASEVSFWIKEKVSTLVQSYLANRITVCIPN